MRGEAADTGDMAPRRGPARRTGRAAALPSGRAVVGGFLVAVAATGVFAAYRDASNGPRRRYVVAARSISAGTTIQASDLEMVAVDLPEGPGSRSFANTSVLLGRIAVAPIAKGELLQASAISDGASAGTSFQVSIPIDRARALDGMLQAGERVDVLVTYSGSDVARTLVVARRAQIVRLASSSRGALAGGGDLIVVLALPSPGEVLAVTHGSQAGKVTLVRATGVDSDSSAGPDTYQPPSKADRAGAG